MVKTAARRTKRRQLFLAVAINLAAAVVAVAAFAAWKHFEPEPVAQTRLEGTIVDGFYEPADDVGYIPIAGRRVTARKLAGDRVLYDVAYTIGPDHFRTVPPAAAAPAACILLFGDSLTFGVGVNDAETFAAQLVQLSGGRVAAENFAISGWGPHQFLAGLQSGRFQRAVKCTPTDALYLMIPDHRRRLAGIYDWDKHGPRYRMGHDGQPVRDGNFDSPGGWSWRRLIGLDPMTEVEEADLMVALIVEGMRELGQRYPGIRLHTASWNSAGETALSERIDYKLTKAGLSPHPVAAMIPRYHQFEYDWQIDPLEAHPNPAAHKRIAEYILREILHETASD